MQRTAAFEIEKADTSAQTTTTVAGVKSERDIWASAGMLKRLPPAKWDSGVGGMKPGPGRRLLESPHETLTHTVTGKADTGGVPVALALGNAEHTLTFSDAFGTCGGAIFEGCWM